jgi:hypothetical protein
MIGILSRSGSRTESVLTIVTGTVEVDERLLAGGEERGRGRQTEKEAVIAVTAGERGRGIGRVRLRRIRPHRFRRRP